MKRVAAWACIALLAVVGVAPGVNAEEAQQDPIVVTLTGISPVSLGESDTLTVSGRIANTGLSDLTTVSVRLTLSASPLADRRAIRQASRGEAPPDSVPLYDTAIAVTDLLAPGITEEFRISVPTVNLPVVTPGVYVVGAEVVGSGPAGFVILGSDQVLIPYVPADIAPIGITWLWPMATWPGQAPDGVLQGDLIPREISDGGRLHAILDVGTTSPGVSWVVDPQLLQVVDDMSDGYLVEKGGEIRPGTAAQAAADWQERMRATLGPREADGSRDNARVRPLLALPYADIDADAVARAGLDSDVTRAATSAGPLVREEVGRDANGTIAWPAGGHLDPVALDLLASAGVSAVVVRERAVPLAVDPGYTPTGHTDISSAAGTVRALILDSGLLAALTMPQASQSQILAARQRFLAEMAYVALDGGPTGRTLVAAAGSTRWDPNPRLLRALLASLRSTAWTRLVPVDQLLAAPATTEVRTVAPYDEKSRSRELGGAYMERIVTAGTSLDSLRGVVANPLSITTPVNAALLRAESSAWRTRPKAGTSLVEVTQQTIDADIGQLYVVPREAITLSGDRGLVPVTVANDFDQPVVIGVSLQGNPSARLDAAPVSDIRIEPGRKASLEVDVRIVGSEPLPVSVQLIDAEGRAYGEPIVVELRTTAYARAALWFAIAAAALLVILVVFDIVRRARSRQGKVPA
ncbi:MAG: hypothetical protein B7C55_02965 [Actinomycetales bacterium mxb001]|nr:MAG: hypothetical protein B7C55_02965 [Actinomycetales bacterium mxb001]